LDISLNKVRKAIKEFGIMEKDGAFESLSLKSRIINAVMGLVIGSILFLPALMLFFQISASIGDHYGFNRNADDFMMGYFCFPLSAVISLICGLFGGEIGNKSSHKYLGAIFGALLGPIVTLLPLSIIILSSWAEN
jgi:hypothetical protein